ncbi:hypothetical protein DPMN_142840 [Dreissena polymorpha]|uniref:Uncharacterized protein n=1 Tax=Dreissena polymorpha TaxID=45954 RepID=A0A9D4GC09_DREPO|nr:hypothetical protein DPMN_142840 [Dreissena polymorpha]
MLHYEMIRSVFQHSHLINQPDLRKSGKAKYSEEIPSAWYGAHQAGVGFEPGSPGQNAHVPTTALTERPKNVSFR